MDLKPFNNPFKSVREEYPSLEDLVRDFEEGRK